MPVTGTGFAVVFCPNAVSALPDYISSSSNSHIPDPNAVGALAALAPNPLPNPDVPDPNVPAPNPVVAGFEPKNPPPVFDGCPNAPVVPVLAPNPLPEELNAEVVLA